MYECWGKKIDESQTVLAQSLKESLEQNESREGEIFFSGDDDPLFEDVKRIVLETQKASASFLQRRLRIGYSRAARLIDMLEEKGIVGPADGAKPRDVFANKADIQFGPDKKPSGLDESEKSGDSEWQKV